MKKIEYRVGNLLDHPGRYLLQGCNAQGKMNSGVAKAIRDRYPKNFEVYEARHDRLPLSLGEVIMANCGEHTILNGITQEFYGYDGAVYVNYDAIERVMENCNILLADEALTEIAMPLIGTDLGGGDWNVIKEIIEQCAVNYQPIVYVLTEDELPK